MSDDRTTLFELKEKAKWSADPEEKKVAIKELSTYGENAISELQEIMSITAYEEIRNACAEAIKSMGTRNNVEINKTYTTDSSNSTADVTTTAKDQKKKKSKTKPRAREKPESG